MSEAIENRDPIQILNRAARYLRNQGKNFNDHDDVFEIEARAMWCLWELARQ